MSKREPGFLLEDILECAEKIKQYIKLMTYDEFISDSKTIDAVIRNFEVIGEASTRLPEEVKDNAPNIDWHKIRGLRNRIAHNYFGLNYEIIWTATGDDLTALIKQIKTLLG